MKKVIAILACVVFAVAAQAQQVYGLDKVVKEGTSFVAYAGGEALAINPYLYKRVKSSPDSYAMVVYRGEKGSMMTLAHRANINYAVLAVDSIGYDEDADVAEVYLSDKSVYKSHNDEWLKVLKGQHVERWLVDGETKTLQHFRTVGRDVELTTAVPYSTVPGAQQVETAMVSNPVPAKTDQEVAQVIPVQQPQALNNTRPTLIRK